MSLDTAGANAGAGTSSGEESTDIYLEADRSQASFKQAELVCKLSDVFASYESDRSMREMNAGVRG